MIYLKTFILCGLICLLGQLILDNTKLTTGHITSIFVTLGAFLSFIGIYKYLTNFSLVGSSLPITSFGNALYKASYEGFINDGIVGMFNNILSTTSSGISSAIFFGFIVSCMFKARD